MRREGMRDKNGVYRGSAIARVIGQNVQKHPDLFDSTVRMWVFEEQVEGRNLTDIINEKHENVKYVDQREFHYNTRTFDRQSGKKIPSRHKAARKYPCNS